MGRLQRYMGAAALVAAATVLAAPAARAHGTPGLKGGTLETVLDEWTLGFRQVNVKSGVLVLHAVNTGRAPHNIAVRPRGRRQASYTSRVLAPGESLEVQINVAAGTYELYCAVPGHRERGMIAAMTVGAAAPGGGY